MEKIVIEIVRPGKISNEYHSFNSGLVTIGRGFENDIILDDPFVSPRHCEIVLAEHVLKVKDCDSRNGIYAESSREKQGEILLTSGDEFIIGKTHVKVYLGSHAVEEALPVESKIRILSIIQYPVSAWILLSFLCWIGWFTGHIETIEKDEHGVAFIAMVMVVFVVMIWAGFWSVINRMIRHKFNYRVHFSVGCLWYLLFTFFNFIFDYAAFYLNNEDLYLFLSGALFVAVSYTGLWTHFHFATRMTHKSKIVFSVSIIAVVFLLGGMVMKYMDEMQYLNMKFYSSLNPPYLGNPKADFIEDMLKKSERVFKEN